MGTSLLVLTRTLNEADPDAPLGLGLPSAGEVRQRLPPEWFRGRLQSARLFDEESISGPIASLGNASPYLVLLDDNLRVEELLPRFTQSHSILRAHLEEWRRLEDGVRAYTVARKKLDLEIAAITGAELPLLAAEEARLSTQATHLQTVSATLSTLIAETEQQLSRDSKGKAAMSYAFERSAQGSFYGIRGDTKEYDGFEGVVEKGNLYSQAWRAQRYISRQSRVREGDAAKLTLESQKLDLDNIKWSLAAVESKLADIPLQRDLITKRKLRIEADAQSLDDRQQVLFADVAGRIAGLLAAARQEVATLDALGVQLARALRNVYGGLFEDTLLTTVEDAGWLSDPEDADIHRLATLIGYFGEVIARLKMRSARSSTQRVVTLTRTGEARWAGKVTVSTEDFGDGAPRLPRLRGVSVAVEQAALESTGVELRIGAFGERNVSRVMPAPAKVDHTSAWPIMIGRPSLRNSPMELPVLGVAAFWNCSLYADFQLDLRGPASLPETFGAVLVLHFEQLHS